MLTLLAILLLSSCSRVRPVDPIDAAAGRYLDLLASLGARDPDSLDFLFGPHSNTPERPGSAAKLSDLARQAADLQADLQAYKPSSPREIDRHDFLLAQTNAIALRVRLLQGSNDSFEEEARTFFGLTATGQDDDPLAQVRTRAALAHLLGDTRNPAHAYARFNAQLVVPSQTVPAVMTEALSRCRASTLSHIALPTNEHVEVQYVFHKPWNAFSRYLGQAHSIIQVNMDFPLTVDRILTLACHEGYPGHHVFNTLRDRSLVERQHRAEWSAQPTFSPQSFVSEAAAAYAPELAFSAEDRLRVERDILFPIAGLDAGNVARSLQIEALIQALSSAEPAIAREYLDGRLEFVRAADALQRQLLMEHPETMLLYLNQYRTYMLTYTLGHDRVRARIERGNPTLEERWRRYEQLMAQPVYSLDRPAD